MQYVCIVQENKVHVISLTVHSDMLSAVQSKEIATIWHFPWKVEGLLRRQDNMKWELNYHTSFFHNSAFAQNQLKSQQMSRQGFKTKVDNIGDIETSGLCCYDFAYDDDYCDNNNDDIDTD